MMQAQPLSPTMVRIPLAAAGPETAGWLCRATSRPAVPLRVVAHRRTASFVELVVDIAMTPRATYGLRPEEAAEGPDEVTFTGYQSPGLARRRLDLWESLPQHPRCLDSTDDLRAFVGCLQDLVDLLVMRIEAMPQAFDLERALPHDLAKILRDQGSPFRFALDAADARRLSAVLSEVYQQKGTERGIANAIRLFLGLEVEEIWCRGITRDEGGGIVVGGDDPVSKYAFDILFPHPLTPQQRERVRAIAEYMRPAHTHFLDILPLPDGTEATQTTWVKKSRS